MDGRPPTEAGSARRADRVDDHGGRPVIAEAVETLVGHGVVGGRLGLLLSGVQVGLQRRGPGGIVGRTHHVAAGIGEPPGQDQQEQERHQDGQHDHHLGGDQAPISGAARQRPETSHGVVSRGGSSVAGRKRSTADSAISCTWKLTLTPGTTKTGITSPSTCISTIWPSSTRAPLTAWFWIRSGARSSSICLASFSPSITDASVPPTAAVRAPSWAAALARLTAWK